MNIRDVNRRLERHRSFWDRTATDRPLIGFQIEKDGIPARWMGATAELLGTGRVLQPDLLQVEDSLPEYLSAYERYESSGQDLFWSAVPLTGIPWMEAMMGGFVVSAQDSFSVEPGTADPGSDSFGVLDKNNPWYLKYMEYATELDRFSSGRFPVGQPILRGPLDTLGALMTIEEMVYGLHDHPDRMADRLDRLSRSFSDLVAAHLDAVSPFFGGSSFGFYNLWSPDRAIWLQEDAVSYLSPEWYKRFQFKNDNRILGSQPHSLFHLHPSAFFTVDAMLELDALDVVQVNRDVNDPPLEILLPTLARILKTKRLLLWGAFDDREIEQILNTLPHRGLALVLFADTPEKGRRTMKRFFGE